MLVQARKDRVLARRLGPGAHVHFHWCASVRSGPSTYIDPKNMAISGSLRSGSERSAARNALLDPAEDQAGVRATEAERVRHDDVDITRARLVRHQIDRRFD
jgi:hypothetical protein